MNTGPAPFIMVFLFSGTLKVVKQKVSIPVYVMIRPRSGDFHYYRDERDTMVEDMKELKTAGADGFVFGILN